MEEPETPSLLSKHNQIKVLSFIQPTSLNDKDTLKMCLNQTFLNVFCIELQTSSTAAEDSDTEPNVLYCHPTDGNPLRGAEGMFVALSQSSEDLTGQPAKCTKLYSDQMTYHVAYFKEGQNLLVFVVRKEAISCHDVCLLMDSVVQVIRFLYASLNLGFRSKKCRRKLKAIFDSVDEILLQSNGKFLMPFFNYVPFLFLPKTVQLRLEEILGHLGIGEVPRAKSQTNLTHQRKILNLVGSCLFFKEYLLCDYLPPNILEDIYLYLKFNQIFTYSKLGNNQQILLWREIFPTKDATQKEIEICYREHECQYFLQVISSGNKTLCIVLQAPNIKIGATIKKLAPPLFYTEQLKNILQRLELVIPEIVEKFEQPSKKKSISFGYLQSSLRQQFASLLKTSATKNTSLPSDKNEISKDPRFLNLTSQPADLFDTVLSNSLILTPKTTIGNTSKLVTLPPILQAKKFRHAIKSEILPNIFELPGCPDGFPIQKLGPCFQGIVVVLYLQSNQENTVKGIRINGCVGSTPDLLSDFNWCCARIKDHFNYRLNRSESDRAALAQSCHIDEYGVLLRHKSTEDKQDDVQDYWVVGRRLKHGHHAEQQIFVCFLDGTPQNLIELAFRLSFGHDFIS